MCHIKHKTYVDQAGHRQVEKVRYVCEFRKRGMPCSITSEDEGEIHTREIRPATSSGHPSRDQVVMIDEPGSTTSRHRSGKTRYKIKTLVLESLGGRSKAKKEKTHSKKRKEPFEVVIDQPELPASSSAPPFYESGPFERPRHPPPPPTHHPPASVHVASRPTRIEIVDPSAPPRRRRRRSEAVIHDRRTEHIPVPPPEPARLERLYQESAESPRPRHDSAVVSPTSSSPESSTDSTEHDNEYMDRMRARESARNRQREETRKRDEEDRRREQLEREAEDLRQARIELDRYHEREEQRRRAREAEELRRREEDLRDREDQLRREDKARKERDEQYRREARAERERQAHQQREERAAMADRDRRERERKAYERWKRDQDLRRYRYSGHDYAGHREPFPNYYEPPPAPPRAPRYTHVEAPYGPPPSMRYAPPPSPREPPRMDYYPAHGYDERHGTYYSESRPGTRIQQHFSWWPSGGALFRRNTYSGRPLTYRASERAARARAMFGDH
ncbi:MAG: hypothetical protein M1821_007994 [Bathelium mastoideum]|nr:MAG: hypothetical protein M1821_007994 [Bathelium mastoideum]